jgi:thiosulfate/3-mercaptopyruvate sulfurtransferase
VGPGDLDGLDALLIDARGLVAYHSGHVPGAVHAPWTRFTDGPLSGTVVASAELQERLRDIGVQNETTVVVYGDWNYGWGEEGRLFWMLEYMGHLDVRVLAGGMPRWRALGRPSRSVTEEVARGDFVSNPRPTLRATTADVLQAVTVPDRPSAVIFDARTVEEFEGSTPYGSARGGHIPGAQHLDWKGLFAPSGQLRPKGEILEILEGLGVGPNTEVITYCTGGVRSAFVYLVLSWVGVDGVRNYDGSWWEWSSQPDLPVVPR